MSPAGLTDDALGREALRGDRAAFTELFGRHEAGLRAVATRLTGDPVEAADIAQEAFLRVFARLDDLIGRDVNLSAYLHRTARNLVYDHGARRGRELPTGEIERAAGADGAAGADPERSALVAAQVAEVRAADARLPERHRLALALREVEGMGYADIGRVLDITPGAVAQLLVRARAALRRELRLVQVDAAAMDPGCRSRLAGIGALIDGELGPDRAHVLSQHLDLCAPCRAARAAFEEARVTYRAWLPLPIVGLGAETARAAEARGLVRFADGRRPAAPRRARRGGAGSRGGSDPGRRRVATAVAGGLLAFLLIGGAGALVATRTGSSGQDPAPVAAAVAPGTTTGAPEPATSVAAVTPAATAATLTTARVATPSSSPPSPAAPVAAPVPAPTPAPAAGETRLTPPATSAPPRPPVTAPARRPRPPSVTVVGDPAPPAPPAPAVPPGPPATTVSEPPPVAGPPVRTDPQEPPTPPPPTPPVLTIPPILTITLPLPPVPVL